MMLDQEAIANAAGVIRADDFYKPAHSHIFDAVHALYAGGQAVDPVTVADELRRSGLLDVVGGHQALVQIMSSTPSTTNAAGYARIIEEHALLRRLIGVAGEIAEIGYSMPDDVTKALDKAETLVYDINQRKVTDSTAKIEELLGANLDRLEQLYGRGDAITGTPTGYADLDDLLSGLQPSTLVIVGARPSMGKALALDTPIPTPSGWTTMGELQEGDQVFDDQGRPCSVTYATPVQTDRACFRVELDDGSTIVADADHQWLAYDLPAWTAYQQLHPLDVLGGPAATGADHAPRVVTTRQMVDEGVFASGARRPNWYLPLAQPLDLPQRDLPVDPYALGLWLAGAGAAPEGVVDPGESLVPSEYLRASGKQRLALVQGVLDAQGTVTDGHGTVELCLDDRDLLAQVHELVCSLGHTPGPINRRLAQLPARGAASTWWFRWMPIDPVFRLDEKLDELGLDVAAPADHRSARRAVRAIRPVASVPVRCITVDGPSHLYLAGDTMVPTHNTSFALGMASHAALYGNHPVLVFSLEMGNLELSQRMLCAEARIDSSRVRTGKLNEDDWNRISGAIGRLASAPIWMDDNPNLTVMEIRSKARRLKSQVGDIGMIIIDYLQLMTGRGSAENRQVEVSEMSRGLKILARELECPVVALSQLSRQLEMRADKRPMLADLRESGCLTADSLVLRADTGAEVTIGELAATGERDIPVWSLDTDLRMVPATMTQAFSTGTKDVFELRLASGRRVTASANHPFLTVGGWSRLDEIAAGSRIAVPRVVPTPKAAHEWTPHQVVLLAHLVGDGFEATDEALRYSNDADPACFAAVETAAHQLGLEPRRVGEPGDEGVPTTIELPRVDDLATGSVNPVAQWLDQWSLLGRSTHETFVPAPVFSLTDDQVALFVGHLWTANGCIGWWGKGHVSFTSTSRNLADDVQMLLLRLGIRSTCRRVRGAPGRPSWQLQVEGRDDQVLFLDTVPIFGQRAEGATSLRERLVETPSAGRGDELDTVPTEVWVRVRQAMADKGISSRDLTAALGTVERGLYRRAPGRERLRQVAALIDDRVVQALASSDVVWDRVVDIVPLGRQEVFDATVEGTHNFVANGIVVENSIEQDADVVMFIYRDDVYNPDSPDRGQAEIIVSKHRNGPTGTARLAFLSQFTRFANMARVD
jgi:replicative DNA helicase